MSRTPSTVALFAFGVFFVFMLWALSLTPLLRSPQ